MIWFVLCGLAAADISVETPPLVGSQTIVVVVDEDGRPRAGETVRVVHRPGMAGEVEVAIGITDNHGRVRWTPDIPGTAIVRADKETRQLQIATAEWPTGTLTLLLLLLLAATSGMAYGLASRPLTPVRRR